MRVSLRFFAPLRFSEPRPASQSRTLHVRRAADNHPRYVISLLTVSTRAPTRLHRRFLYPGSFRNYSALHEFPLRDRVTHSDSNWAYDVADLTTLAIRDFDDGKSMREVNEKKKEKERKKRGKTRARLSRSDRRGLARATRLVHNAAERRVHPANVGR